MRMKKNKNIKRALFSVPLHRDLASFVAKFKKAGWVVIATADVYEFFRKKGIMLAGRF